LIKNIRTIRMKLSDNERENITRLIKIKSLH
jgi:vacuolar-type H+-ATPase subunit D/Vma8